MSNTTDPVQTKNQDLAKAYEFKDVEQKWYTAWEKQKRFQATMDDDKPSFSIVIPPPNVTGVLHVGHALNNTLQDILVRYRRMQGFNTLWLPGTDHAGIATQNVVEKQLAQEGTSRHDIGRGHQPAARAGLHAHVRDADPVGGLRAVWVAEFL